MEQKLPELPAGIPGERECADWIARVVWPDGFVCGWCESRAHYRIARRPRVFVCAGCGRHRSVTAETALHRSKVPLGLWVAAAICMARPGGISASAFSRDFGLRYETAWRLLHKLRAGLGALFRVLQGAIEVGSSFTRTRPPRGRRGGRLEGLIALVDAGKQPPSRVTLHRTGDRAARDLLIRFRGRRSERATGVLTRVRGVLRATYRSVGTRWLENYLRELQFRINGGATEELGAIFLARAVGRRWWPWRDLRAGCGAPVT